VGTPSEEQVKYIPAFDMRITAGELSAIFKKLGSAAVAPLLKEALDEEVRNAPLAAVGISVAAQGIVEPRDPFLNVRAHTYWI
jgi:hypothetical protein